MCSSKLTWCAVWWNRARVFWLGRRHRARDVQQASTEGSHPRGLNSRQRLPATGQTVHTCQGQIVQNLHRSYNTPAAGQTVHTYFWLDNTHLLLVRQYRTSTSTLYIPVADQVVHTVPPTGQKVHTCCWSECTYLLQSENTCCLSESTYPLPVRQYTPAAGQATCQTVACCTSTTFT